MKAVDIIIPVYNAYDDLMFCVESIKRHTDLQAHTLILVNDKSTDERIAPYLDSLQGKNIVIKHNPKNMGFSENINFGMGYSENDVILLNSDTVVTSGWVEKIQRCAYSDGRIATVTPISNNATICSVPKFLEENDLPEGIGIEDMAHIVEMASLQIYPEIPTAHGFSMFIKREVIKEIGEFDAEKFGRGYGEENDFCYRAIQAGYIHVMCDDTFIFHKGTSSFVSAEKQRYIQEHEIILKQRYPKEVHETALHCMENPNKFVFDNINNFLKIWGNKKNILYLLHSDFKENASDNCGGTQLHVKDLMLALRDEYNVFVLARDSDYLNLTIYGKNGSSSYHYYIGGKEKYPVFTDKKLKGIYEAILDVFQIERVHIHHTYGLSLDMFYAADERGIPVFTTLHDYYFICPNIKMLDCNNQLCIGKESQSRCRLCLTQNIGVSERVNYLDMWREKSEAALQISNAIVVPSISAGEIIEEYFPKLKGKLHVIEHGSDAFQEDIAKIGNITVSHNVRVYIDQMGFKKDGAFYLRGWAYDDTGNMEQCGIWIEMTDSKLNQKIFKAQQTIREDVAAGNAKRRYSGMNLYVQTLGLAKGEISIKVLIQYEKGEMETNGEIYHIWMKEVNKKDKFHVAFLGGLNVAKGAKLAYQLIKHSPEYIQWFIFGDIGYSKLADLRQENLVKSGHYKKEDIQHFLANAEIDLVCILSIWPETFCYTLSEAVLCGIPTLVTGMGALKERVEKMECGWVVEKDSQWEEILGMVKKISKDRTEFDKIKKHVKSLSLRSVQEMAEDYRKLYEQGKESGKAVILNLSKKKRKVLLCDNEGIEQGRVLSDKEIELQQIKNSMTYGLLRKIVGINFPGKMRLRKWIYNKRAGQK